jgi:hypothetical protein
MPAPTRAAMLEVEQDRQRVLHDTVGLAALDVGDEPDAARILVQSRIIKATLGAHAPIRRTCEPCHHRILH